MKANKVPEKLYGCYKGNGNFFMDYRPFPNDESIEYIRADAFVEKACSWLENNLQGIVGGSIYIEDFKNYMKRE